MNKKIVALLAVATALLMVAPLVYALPRVVLWTDKPEYAPGESGTLYFAYTNEADSAVTLKRVRIVYTGWQAPINGQWEGNQTIELTNVALASGGNYTGNTKFTVPTDGRAQSTLVQVTFETDPTSSPSTYTATIEVSQTPKYMDQVITLFTIQVVLLIVCTIIIAATIFLSARRPQIMWKTEEKS